jgi:hypothetical protein
VADQPAFNPFLPEFREDPYRFFRSVRQQDPVHWTFLSFWLVTRYADVVRALRDPRFSADPRNWSGYAQRYRLSDGEPGPLAQFHSKWLLGIDPPDHTRLRRLASSAFTPLAVERMRPRVQRIVDDLFARVSPAGRMDVIADVAYPLPVLVIADMLGVPPEDAEPLMAWSRDLSPSFDPLMPRAAFERANAVIRTMTDYFSRLIDTRRTTPTNDLLSAFIAARDQGDRLSDEELLATCILLFFAGHETTVNLIGNGVLTLLRHPRELDRLRADPALIAPAVEEMLRFESPVQLTYRMALEDVELGGRRIERGQQVALAIGAANRDPARFDDPDAFEVARRDNHHIAFGFGIHYCFGAPLARLQAQIVVRALIDRMPSIGLEDASVSWRPNIVLRGLQALPVRFAASDRVA